MKIETSLGQVQGKRWEKMKLRERKKFKCV